MPRQLTGCILLSLLGLAVWAGGGCNFFKPAAKPSAANNPIVPVQVIKAVSLDAAGPILDDTALRISAARNETASVVLQLTSLPRPVGANLTLRIPALQLPEGGGKIDTDRVKIYQVLSMPVDANRAGYVRHTGLKAASRSMPRALLPVAVDHGSINLSTLRDPSEPFKPASRLGISDEPATLWIDLAIPPTATPGQYVTTVEVLKDGQKIDSVPLTLNVYDFVLPDERHLHMVGRIEWDALEALYPDLFENITPNLMDRKNKRYDPAIKLLDQLVLLAQEHRTTAVVPRLQPVAKWPANQAPQVFWSEFDSVAGPWLTGEAFADKVPLGYWPMPRVEYLDRFPPALQNQYWTNATSHFFQQGWVDRAWVEVEKDTPGRASALECVKLSSQAAGILAIHPKVRVTLPLEEQQLQFLNPGNANLLDRGTTTRLMSAAPGLLYIPIDPASAWPSGVAHTAHWLRTDLPGLVPYIGAGGDEKDVRLWAWLAYLRQTQVIGWDGALPHAASPNQAADPNELTWFYPGRWFGIEEPVPTIQLKWLRRAQQDYEYLYLSQQRGERLYALLMAQLMIKPVRIGLNEEPDPTHGLLSGTTDPQSWSRALDLLARNISLHAPGEKGDERKMAVLESQTRDWIVPQDKPLLIPRNTSWGWFMRQGNWVDLRLGLDIYNAASVPLEGDIQWVSAPRGWEISPQPLNIDPVHAIQTYQVKQFETRAMVDLDRLSAETRKPIQLKFIDSVHKRPFYMTVSAPVAPSDKREGQLTIDGKLGDWDDAADAIQLGPMVTMLDRPGVQRQAMQLAATSTALYSNWADKRFYVGFKLDGLASGDTHSENNSVDYQLRRAWGEDLCEMLIQPIYAQELGQIVHIVCKPKGQIIVSAKPSPKNRKLQGNNAQVIAGAAVRYASTTESALWRGELAIPWEIINDPQHKGVRPTLLRFNFIQYKSATGESSSWAGPIDFGRDDTFMGLLYLRDLKAPGPGAALETSPSLSNPVGERLFGR